MVVAKYKEDVSWTKSVKHKITIYDKDDDIPNVGREAHTYLWHIVNQYDNLADTTLFVQGDPLAHTNLANKDEIADYINVHESFADYEPFASPTVYFERTGTSLRALNAATYNNVSSIYYTSGAQFYASKGAILSKSQEWYKSLLQELSIPRFDNDQGTFNAWTMEGLWSFIFDKNIKEKLPLDV